MGKVEQDENGWACWRCLGRVAIQVTGAGLVEKVTLEQIRKAVRGSVVQLSGKSTAGGGNSQFTGPGVDTRSLHSENCQEASVAGTERSGVSRRPGHGGDRHTVWTALSAARRFWLLF